jgi:hypothetical protein
VDSTALLGAFRGAWKKLLESQETNLDLKNKLHIVNAQLAIGATYNTRLQCQLAHKEKKKHSTGQMLLGDGLPRIMTSPEVRAQVREKLANKEQALVEKQARMRARQYNSACGRAKNHAWEAAKNAHMISVKAWEGEMEKAKLVASQGRLGQRNPSVHSKRR